MSPASSVAKLKVLVRLEQDADGYPPFAVEGLWTIERPSGVVIVDNIPFFARGVAPGDTIEVEDAEGELWLKRVVSSGGSSVFRIRAANEADLRTIREELLDLGLPSEVDSELLLVAVEVPATSEIRSFLSYLMENQDKSRFEFEEAALRHALPE